MANQRVTLTMSKTSLFYNAKHYKRCFERKADENRLLRWQIRNMRVRLVKIRKEIDYLLQHPWSSSAMNRRWKK